MCIQNTVLQNTFMKSPSEAIIHTVTDDIERGLDYGMMTQTADSRASYGNTGQTH